MLVAPAWAAVFILLITSKKVRENEELVFGLAAGLGALVCLIARAVRAVRSAEFWIRA